MNTLNKRQQGNDEASPAVSRTPVTGSLWPYYGGGFSSAFCRLGCDVLLKIKQKSS